MRDTVSIYLTLRPEPAPPDIPEWKPEYVTATRPSVVTRDRALALLRDCPSLAAKPHEFGSHRMILVTAPAGEIEKTFGVPLMKVDGHWNFREEPIIPPEWAGVIVGVMMPLIGIPA